jgi:hypothetical protein
MRFVGIQIYEMGRVMSSDFKGSDRVDKRNGEVTIWQQWGYYKSENQDNLTFEHYIFCF